MWSRAPTTPRMRTPRSMGAMRVELVRLTRLNGRFACPARRWRAGWRSSRTNASLSCTREPAYSGWILPLTTGFTRTFASSRTRRSAHSVDAKPGASVVLKIVCTRPESVSRRLSETSVNPCAAAGVAEARRRRRIGGTRVRIMDRRGRGRGTARGRAENTAFPRPAHLGTVTGA